MGQCQVLFSGEVVEGAQEAQVRMNLARRFGLDERKVGQLFSGRTVVIESGMEVDQANVLQKELSDLGAVVRVKDLTPEDQREPKVDARDYKADSHHVDYTLNDITAAHIECPRCGHLQLDAPNCGRCGIDMASASKQKRKEDRQIERQIHQLNNKPAGGKPGMGVAERSTRATRSAQRQAARPESDRNPASQPEPRKGLLRRLGFGRG
jgi:hypothetical protein